jgi:hypothetical protein
MSAVQIALRLLNGLVEQGMEYPDAHSFAVTSSKLSDAEAEQLAELYDTQASFQPDRYEQLVTAVTALLPEVESEIEQRKTSGIDEDWKQLQQLVDNVRSLL